MVPIVFFFHTVPLPELIRYIFHLRREHLQRNLDSTSVNLALQTNGVSTAQPDKLVPIGTLQE